MSSPSPAVPSRVGLKKVKPTTWYTPPPDTPLYTKVPDVAPLVRSGCSTLQWLVYEYLTNPRNGAKQTEAGGWVCEGRTYARIAHDLRISRSSVWRAIKEEDAGLIDMECLDVRAVYSGRNAANGRGRRVKTVYYAPPWKEVLERRRAREGVILTAAGHPIIIGRTRRYLSTDEKVAWKIDTAAAPAFPRRETKKTFSAEEVKVDSSTQVSVKKQAPVSEMPSPDKQDEATILQALLEACPANLTDACDLLAAARNAAPEFPVPVLVILAQMAEIRARKTRLDAKKRDPNPIITPKWFIDRMPSHIEHWRVAERVRSQNADREARAARDSRVNSLAQAIVGLRRLGDGDGTTAPGQPSDREFFESFLAAADADELEAAQALAADTMTRSA